MMLLLATVQGLPAPPNDWQIVREVFRHEDGSIEPSMFWGVLVVIAILATFLAAMRLATYLRQRRFASRPLQVFHRLAGELGLALADQWLLVCISRQQTLPTPLTLLLSSETLRHHGERYVQTLPPRRRARMSARLSGIAMSLFG